MADIQAISIAINGVNNLSGPVGAAVGSLNTLESTAGKIGGAFVGMAAAAAKAAAAVAAISFTAVAAGMTTAVTAAANFEKEISGIAAVTGATADQIKGLSATALQLGKDTSFSAAEAAQGMSELAKAGVSMADIMGGGARAALDLAAAGGVEVATAAEIASNAMNVFNKTGAEMAHVADVIAGAANASAIDVNDYKFSLSAAGAVAATVGVSFEDLSTAIAVMGQAGIKGSDAGTSLKTMLTNLTPQTKQQIAAARELGILTEDGANAFFDASGKAKSLAEISEILQTSTANMTKQQKLATLETLFGTDALRAAAIMADAGAEGFRDMADAIGQVSAQDVANTRLDNLAGSIEKLKGSVETIAISFGLKFTPALKRGVDILTDFVNRAEPSITRFADRAATGLDTLITTVTTGAPALIAFGQGLIPLARSYLPMLSAAFERVKDLFGGAGSQIGGGISNAIGTLRDAIEPLIPVAEAVGQAFVTNLIANFRFLTDRVLPPLVSIVQQTAGFFVSTLMPAAQQTGNVMRGIFGDTLDWLATTVWPPFLNVLTQTAQFFTSRILPILPTVANALRTVLGESVQWVADVAWPALLTAAGKVVTFLTGTVLPVLPGLARQLRDVLGSAITWVAETGWPSLVSAGEAVASWITGTAIPAITQLVDWLGPKITAAVTWITETGWPALVSAGEAVTSWVMGTAIPALTQLWDWLSPKLQAALEWITTTGWPMLVSAGEAVSAWITGTAIPALTQLWDWLSPKLQAAIEWVMSTGWPGMVSAGEQVSSWIMDTAVPALTDLWTWLSEKLQPAVEWLSGTGWPALVEIGGALNTAWEKTVEFATQLWEQLAKSDIVDVLTDAFKNLWEGAKILVETFWPEMKKGADDSAAALPEANTVIDALVQIARVGAGFILAFSEGFKVLAESLRAVKEAATGMPDWLIEGIRKGAAVGGFGPGSSLIPGFLPPTGGGQTQNQSQQTSSASSAGAGPIDNSSRESFIRTAYPYALDAAGGDATLAQQLIATAISENGNVGSGKDLGADMGFNVGGIQGVKGTAGSFWASDAGNMREFAAYNNLSEGFAAVRDLVTSAPRYQAAYQQYQQTGDVDAFWQQVNQAGYAEDPEWARKVGSIRRNQVAPITAGLPSISAQQMSNVTRYDGLSDFSQSQQQWAQWSNDANAICGPYLASLFTDAVGRPPSPEEARALAEKMGIYSSAGSGTGILDASRFDEYATALIQQANPGSGASVQQAMRGEGWNTNAQASDLASASLAGGSPFVGFNTSGHYFGADQYDPATGKFHVGGTGLSLAGGSEWMSVDQMTSKMGGLIGVLTLVGGQADATTVAVNDLGQGMTGVQTPMAGATDTIIAQGEALTSVTGTMTAATDSATTAGEGIAAANEQITASFDVMAQGALTSVTDLGTGVLTTVQDMSGNTVATITDMAGNVTSQSATMASGVSLSMADMGVQTTTSVNEMAGTITTVMTDTAGNAVTTITNMQGQVVGQFTTMQTEAGSAVSQMANVSREQFGNVVKAAGGIPPAIDAVNEAFDNISTPDFRDTVKQFGEASKAAREYAKRVKEAAEATESLPGRKGGEKGGDKDRDDNPFAKRASGGWTRGLTLVGEEGPEFISTSRPMYVSNADDTRRMMGGAEIDYDRLAAAIAKAVPRGNSYVLNGVHPESVFSEADRRARVDELMYRIGG